MEFDKINIRGVDIANVTMDEAVEIAKNYICVVGDGALGVPHTISVPRAIYTPNAEIMQTCIDDKTGSFFEIINSADMVIPDGAGVVLASKILKTPLKQKVAGVDLAFNLIDYLNQTGGILFLLGSTEENVEKAKLNLNEKYKNLKVFCHHGHFFDPSGIANPDINQKVLTQINNSSPDVVFVSLGAIGLKQEKWIFENKNKLNAKLLIGLGGTVDIIAGVKKPAPKIFIKLNLEWFYHLIKHPSRIKRYMKLPKFIFGTVFAKKNKKKHKNN